MGPNTSNGLLPWPQGDHHLNCNNHSFVKRNDAEIHRFLFLIKSDSLRKNPQDSVLERHLYAVSINRPCEVSFAIVLLSYSSFPPKRDGLLHLNSRQLISGSSPDSPRLLALRGHVSRLHNAYLRLLLRQLLARMPGSMVLLLALHLYLHLLFLLFFHLLLQVFAITHSDNTVDGISLSSNGWILQVGIKFNFWGWHICDLLVIMVMWISAIISW